MSIEKRGNLLSQAGRQDLNQIGKTTTFSGADITVVAYRNPAGGLNSPASKFEVDRLNAQLERANNELEDAKLARRNALAALERAEAEAESAEERFNRQQAARTSLGVDTRNSSFDSEGKFQNEVNRFSQQLQLANKRVSDANAAFDSILLKRNSFDEAAAPAVFVLGGAHTLSYSSFREKYAVRGLGATEAKTYTRGPRTIAGSIVFTVFQEHEFLKMVDFIDPTGPGKDPRAVMIDQVLPFNLLLLFANEFGSYSALHLLNIDIASEGQEMSIDQVITNNSMNYYATDMIPMTNLGNAFNSFDEMIVGTINDVAKAGYDSGTSGPKRRIDSLLNPFRNSEESNRLLNQSRGLF